MLKTGTDATATLKTNNVQLKQETPPYEVCIKTSVRLTDLRQYLYNTYRYNHLQISESAARLGEGLLSRNTVLLQGLIISICINTQMGIPCVSRSRALWPNFITHIEHKLWVLSANFIARIQHNIREPRHNDVIWVSKHLKLKATQMFVQQLVRGE